MKPHILIDPVLFSYINNSYYCKAIFSLCTSKALLQETAGKWRPLIFHLERGFLQCQLPHKSLRESFYTNAITPTLLACSFRPSLFLQPLHLLFPESWTPCSLVGPSKPVPCAEKTIAELIRAAVSPAGPPPSARQRTSPAAL